MEKRGHLLVTVKLAEGLQPLHRACLKLGCVLPDLLVHTYAVGHTWNTAWGHVERKMRLLAQAGRESCWSYLMLGYILHYVEDFFTWPHNTAFTGNLAEHVRYEHDFTQHLKNDVVFWDMDMGNREPAPVELVTAYLRWLHGRYVKEPAGWENDSRYIGRAAALVARSYYGIFQQNGMLARERLDTEGLMFHKIFIRQTR